MDQHTIFLPSSYEEFWPRYDEKKKQMIQWMKDNITVIIDGGACLTWYGLKITSANESIYRFQ